MAKKGDDWKEDEVVEKNGFAMYINARWVAPFESFDEAVMAGNNHKAQRPSDIVEIKWWERTIKDQWRVKGYLIKPQPPQT